MLLLGVSVYVAFGSVLLFIALVGDQGVAGFLPRGSEGLRSLVLLAVPLFMIAGAIMERGKIAAPLVSLAEMFIGHIKGGLSASAVLASGVFGSISGSANATLTCIGGIMMPHLRRANYPKGTSAALIVSAAPLGLLIPPSASHILYGWVAQQNVLRCFLSTVIPALILITLLIATNQFLLRKVTDLKLTDRPTPFMPTFVGQGRLAGPALMMPVIILGGIYGGIMTPTEAAGIAVIYAIPIAIYYYKGLTWKTLAETVGRSGITIGVVLCMVFMVLIVSDNLISQGAPRMGAIIAGARLVEPVLAAGGFSHGFTYAGNPLACAAGLAVLEEMEDQGLIENAARMGEVLMAELRALMDRYPFIGDVRGKGLLTAFEFVADRATMEPLDPKLNAHERLVELAYARGLIIYSRRTRGGKAGDHFLVAPPLIITKAQIKEMMVILRDALDAFANEHGLPIEAAA